MKRTGWVLIPFCLAALLLLSGCNGDEATDSNESSPRSDTQTQGKQYDSDSSQTYDDPDDGPADQETWLQDEVERWDGVEPPPGSEIEEYDREAVDEAYQDYVDSW